MRRFLALFLVALAPAAHAAVAPVALTDRASWPLALDTDAGFDTASRAEILAFTRAFAAVDGSKNEAIAAMSRLKGVDAASLETWRRRVRRLVVENFRAASKSCTRGAPFCAVEPPKDYPALQAFADGELAKVPANLAPWLEEMRGFWALYVVEQVRLAALFPRVTSEILPLDEAELLGSDDPDKSFLLTFDDGPTPAGGATDRMVSMLRTHHVNGTFFTLGLPLEARRKAGGADGVKALYAGMCLASHGQEHRSHATWDGALPAMAAFHAKLSEVLPAGQPALAFFRPPYGQRTPELLAALAAGRVRDVLWNIDSQDWQKSVTAPLAAGRVTTLMLLWRRGIVLFHDIHPKAEGALPAVWKATDGAHLTWRDCRAE